MTLGSQGFKRLSFHVSKTFGDADPFPDGRFLTPYYVVVGTEVRDEGHRRHLHRHARGRSELGRGQDEGRYGLPGAALIPTRIANPRGKVTPAIILSATLLEDRL